MKTILLLLLLLLLLSITAQASDYKFRWGRADDGTISYNFYGITGMSTNLLASVPGIDSTNLTLSIPNAIWKFFAKAVYPEGECPVPSNILPVSIWPAPAPVVSAPSISLTPGNYTATLFWTKPPAEYYATNFIARLVKNGGGATTVITTASTVTSFGHLDPGGYTFSVAPLNMTGEGMSGFRAFNVQGGPKGLEFVP